MGLAATNNPATPPPTTRPSGLARDTLIPPDLLLVPPVSLGMNEPDKERISNRPCKHKRGNTWDIPLGITARRFINLNRENFVSES